MAESLKALKVEGKILIIANTQAAENGQLELAARNLPNVKIILPSNLNVKDLLEADSIVMTEASIIEITGPKISMSLATSMVFVTSTKIVGS